MSGQNKLYTIPLQKTEKSVQESAFVINTAFIEQYNIEEVEDADVTMHVIVKNHNYMRTADVTMEGSVTVLCDRCLQPYEMAVKHSESFIIKVDEYGELYSDDENVIIISSDDTQLDMSNLFREMIIVSLPLKKVHPTNLCDTSMKKYIISDQKVQNNNEIDSRWESLKNLFDN